MSRKLSLSQAARLLGITRKDIQEQVLQENLTVFEGTVTLDDLKIAFPDHQYEDNTMVERMQKNITEAVHKMALNEKTGVQLEALSKRAYALNRELSIQKAKADYYEELISKLKHKFIDASTTNVDKSCLVDLQQWLSDETTEVQLNIDQNSHHLLEQQVSQFMLPHVRLLPSRHDYTSDKTQTLLESALHSGLAVDYGCSNGKCGKCKVKLLSGSVEKVRHTDYVLSADEKRDNYILSCAHRAVTDIVLESEEAVSIEDIPLQNIETKLKKISLVNENVYVLDLKTPRSQRLRFLAGQEICLTVNGDNGETLVTDLAIASCPCDDMNLQFHSPKADNDPVMAYLASTNKKLNVSLEGPTGGFILDEDSPRALVFIAIEEGFSNIKSLVEHALALDMAEKIHFYWIVKSDEGLYMKNLCRSWNDALDNFHFHPIVCDKNCDHNVGEITDNLIKQIQEYDKLINFDFYISASKPMTGSIKENLIAQGCVDEQVHHK